MVRSVPKLCRVCLLLCLVAVCSCDVTRGDPGAGTPQERTGLSQEEAADAAWKAFEPNTSSLDRGNWEVVEAREVAGREVLEEFEGHPAPGCWVGPTPPANRQISSSGQYWYVHLKARPATPLPSTGTVPPTAPPRIPEAFVREGWFLLDRASGRVVARKISCVIY